MEKLFSCFCDDFSCTITRKTAKQVEMTAKIIIRNGFLTIRDDF